MLGGLLLSTIGFLILILSDSAGQNWASLLAPILIIGGYASVGFSLWFKAPNKTQERPESWIYFFVFLANFVFCLYLLYPTNGPFNSSEYAAAAYTLGIPHTPGYPLFVLFGKVFTTIIPFGNPAYRVNLMSAVFMALSNVIFCAILINVFKNKVIAVLGSLLFALTHVLLAQAVLADTMPLNFCLALLMIYAVIVLQNIPLLAFIFALALGNHHTSILLSPAFLCLIFYRKLRIDRKIILSSFLLFLFGLSIYVYLPIRSIQNPSMNYGQPKTLVNFLRMATRRDYGYSQLAPLDDKESNKPVPQRIAESGDYLVSKIISNYSVWGLFLALAGLVWLFKFDRSLGLFLLIFFAIPFSVLGTLYKLPSLEQGHFYGAVFDRVVVLLFLPIPLWIVAACHGIGEIVKARFSVKRLPGIAGFCAIFPALLFGFQPIERSYNQRNSFYAYDFGMSVLRGLPRDSFVLFPGDIFYFASQYLRYAIGKRKDVNALHGAYFQAEWARQWLAQKWPGFAAADPHMPVPFTNAFITRLAQEKPVFISDRVVLFTDIHKFKFESYGFAYKIAGNLSVPFAERHKLSELNVLRGAEANIEDQHPLIKEIRLLYAQIYSNWAKEWSRASNKEEALNAYYKGWYYNPLLWETSHNIGALLLSDSKFNAAEMWFKRTLTRNPRSATTHYLLSQVYYRLSRPSEAINELDIAISLAPGNPEFLRTRQILQHSR